MNNSNYKLTRIVELLRKDTGINNSIDAIEQLSLLLLIKYFYDVSSCGQSDIRRSSFRELFCEVNDFSIIKNIFHEVIRGNESFFDKSLFGDNSWRNIEVIFDNIPLRIRSLKVLEAALYGLEELDFDEFLSVNFEQLLSSMVKDSSSSGAFHSPRPLVKAMVKVSNPSPQTSIYDPAMGTGRTFVEVEKYLFETYENRSFEAIGNDISPFAYLIGILNLLLNGIDIKKISLSDSLLTENNLKYDLILSGVPFGKASEISKYEYYYHGYSGSLEAMFLKHVMDKLAIGGRAALVVPDGVLFNSSNQLDMLRRQLLTKFNLHSILSLPNGTLAPYSGVKVSVLFFDNTVPGKDIWFYELSTAKPLGKLNLISDIDFKEFVSQFESRKTSGNSFLIDKQSLINDKNCDLSFPLLKKEGQLKFNKNEMIDSLKKEHLAFIELIASHFENISSNIDVQYFETVTLKSICKLKTGDNLNKSEVFNSGAYPVYGGNGIIGYYGQSNRDGDSVIIGKVGMYCGNIHFSSKPYWLTSNAISLELTDSNAVFAPYLAHLLKSLDLNKLSTGTVQKFVSINQLYSLEISLPSYEKQVELSNWFDTLEENRVKIKQLLSNFSNELDSVTTSSIIEKALKNGVTL